MWDDGLKSLTFHWIYTFLCWQWIKVFRVTCPRQLLLWCSVWGQFRLWRSADRRKGSRLRAGRCSCTPSATRAPARREVTLGRTGGWAGITCNRQDQQTGSWDYICVSLRMEVCCDGNRDLWSACSLMLFWDKARTQNRLLLVVWSEH